MSLSNIKVNNNLVVGIDDELNANSNNLARSGECFKKISNLENITFKEYNFKVNEQIYSLSIFLEQGIFYIFEEESDIQGSHNYYIKGTTNPILYMVNGRKREFVFELSGELNIFIPNFVEDSYNVKLKISRANSLDGLSDNILFNDIVKELYIQDNIDLNEVRYVDIYYDFYVEGNRYATLLRFKTNTHSESSILDMGTHYAGRQHIKSGIYKYGNNYAVVDWSKVPYDDGVVSIYNIKLNVEQCKNIDFSPSILKYINNRTDKIIENMLSSTSYGRNGIGFSQKENIDDCDFCYFPVYGQSFTYASDGGYRLTNEYDDDCYMVGDSTFSWNDPILKHLTTYNHLEYTHADAISLISKLWKKYAHKHQKFIVGSYGMGGKTILELTGDNGLPDDNWFEDRFLNGIRVTKEAVEAENKTFNCPCILFMQGESDYKSGTNGPNGCNGDKELYKQRFIVIKNQMQDAVMQATGQTNKPTVMVYVVGGEAFNDNNEGISQAVNELSEENNDVISIGAYYLCPDFYYHLTPDGRRWLGEIIAKVYYEYFIVGVENTINVEKVSYYDKKIFIKIKNAVLPLQIDTKIMSLKENYGFSVMKNFNITNHYQDVATVSIHTGITLYKGIDYKFRAIGTGRVNIFIDGDTERPHVYYNLSEADGQIIYTPYSTGELILYCGADSNLSINIIGKNLIQVSSIEIIGETIILNLEEEIQLPIFVTYGNNLVNGGGNIKDSDPWVSYYRYESNDLGSSERAITYVPLWKDGTTMIGHNYDMHKWLPNFGVEIIE